MSSYLNPSFYIYGLSETISKNRAKGSLKVCSSIGTLRFKETKSNDFLGKTLDAWDQKSIRDGYYDTQPHVLRVGGATAHVNIDDRAYNVNRGAKLALSLYNRENQKNFNFLKVVKLNTSCARKFMTLCAQDGDSDECHLFRCIVNMLKQQVLLCEIKCTGEISMLVDNVDDYVKKLCQRDEDQPSVTWYKHIENT